MAKPKRTRNDHDTQSACFLCMFFVRKRRITRHRRDLDIAPRAGQVSAMTANQTQTVEAVIVGAGMAGLTLAHALASAGIEVAVVDRADPANFTDPAFDGRTTAIAAGSAKVLEGIGLWSDLAPKSCPIDT
ncbi:MAG: FAD-dependent oxidoreductase, partial [Rhodospirillaceae bacterium]|nr:FAD-dependent oxidoreductase [Rhodospirillaceae bacterium]